VQSITTIHGYIILRKKVWNKAVPNIKSSKRGSIGTAYDPVNHAVVLFGGYSENGKPLRYLDP